MQIKGTCIIKGPPASRAFRALGSNGVCYDLGLQRLGQPGSESDMLRITRQCGGRQEGYLGPEEGRWGLQGNAEGWRRDVEDAKRVC
eukprot:4548698-Pyramimonas_sp.AAC.2